MATLNRVSQVSSAIPEPTLEQRFGEGACRALKAQLDELPICGTQARMIWQERDTFLESLPYDREAALRRVQEAPERDRARWDHLWAKNRGGGSTWQREPYDESDPFFLEQRRLVREWIKREWISDGMTWPPERICTVTENGVTRTVDESPDWWHS